MKTALQIGIIALVVAGLGFLTAKLAILGPIEVDVARLTEDRNRLTLERGQLVQALEQSQKNGPVDAGIIPANLLARGQEEALLRTIFDLASSTSLTISSCRTLRTFTVQPKEEESGGAETPAFNPAASTQALPQLDDNGMPVGSAEEEPVNQATEVLPLRLKMAGTYSGWGKFLHELKKSAQLFSISRLSMKITGNKTVKGELELYFPFTGSAKNPIPAASR